MEVANHRAEEEVVEQLQTRRRRRPDLADSSSSDEDNAHVHSNGHKGHEDQNGASEKSVYFDKKEESKLQWSVSGKKLIADNLDIPEIVNAISNHQNVTADETLSSLNASVERSEEETTITKVDKSVRINDLMGDSDEEIELEFERAVDKVHTHTPYCPNCNLQITKVILRRKKKDIPRKDRPVDLFGCLKCFTIFIPSGNCLNVFNIFKGPESTVNGGNNQVLGNSGGSNNAKGKLTETGPHPEITPPISTLPNDYVAIGIPGESDGTGDVLKAPKLNGDETEGGKYEHPTGGHVHGEASLGNNTSGPRGNIDASAREPAEASGTYHSKSLEILKCIVYGGLLECIASLSIVSSAAASDASTLNIIAIGLATVFSGLILFGHTLMDLNNDIVSTSTSNQLRDKYQELLGTRGHFALHASFATLSFLLFGLVPPTVYGFMFRESDNKDYKILAVAVASFACIFVLAVAKAYVRRPERYTAYVKTTLYYVTMAASVSGVSYAAGDLVGKLMREAGWFEPANLLVHGMTSASPAWGSY